MNNKVNVVEENKVTDRGKNTQGEKQRQKVQKKHNKEEVEKNKHEERQKGGKRQKNDQQVQERHNEVEGEETTKNRLITR